MDAVLLIATIALLALTGCVLVLVRRRRCDARTQWYATRDRDWTDDELDALASTDIPGDLADLVA